MTEPVKYCFGNAGSVFAIHFSFLWEIIFG